MIVKGKYKVGDNVVLYWDPKSPSVRFASLPYRSTESLRAGAWYYENRGFVAEYAVVSSVKPAGAVASEIEVEPFVD